MIRSYILGANNKTHILGMTEKLSERIKQAEKTGKLDLSNAFLSDVPNEVLTITNLRSLNLNRNPLKVRSNCFPQPPLTHPRHFQSKSRN
jgi:hypothetical protein